MITKKKCSIAASALILGAVGAVTAHAGQPTWMSVSANIATATLRDYWYVVNGGGLGGQGAALNTNRPCSANCYFNVVWLGTTNNGAQAFALQTPLVHYVTAINDGGMGGPNDATSPIHTDTFPNPVYADNVLKIINLGNNEVMLLTPNGDLVSSVDYVVGNDPQNSMPFHTNATSIGTWETFFIMNPNNYVYPSSSNGSTQGALNIAADFIV